MICKPLDKFEERSDVNPCMFLKDPSGCWEVLDSGCSLKARSTRFSDQRDSWETGRSQGWPQGRFLCCLLFVPEPLKGWSCHASEMGKLTLQQILAVVVVRGVGEIRLQCRSSENWEVVYQLSAYIYTILRGRKGPRWILDLLLQICRRTVFGAIVGEHRQSKMCPEWGHQDGKWHRDFITRGMIEGTGALRKIKKNTSKCLKMNKS